MVGTRPQAEMGVTNHRETIGKVGTHTLHLPHASKPLDTKTMLHCEIVRYVLTADVMIHG